MSADVLQIIKKLGKISKCDAFNFCILLELDGMVWGGVVNINSEMFGKIYNLQL